MNRIYIYFLILFFAFCFSAPIAAQPVSQSSLIKNVATLPGSCASNDKNQRFVFTLDTSKFYKCVSGTYSEIAGSAGGSSNIPTSLKAELPPAGTAGQQYKLTDGNKSVVVDTGTQWVEINGGVFNVKLFGAKGDGTTDDTGAIQAAIDAAKLSNKGGTVLFPRPDVYYKCDGSLDLNFSVGVQLIGTHSPSGFGLGTAGGIVFTGAGLQNQKQTFTTAGSATLTITSHGYTTGTPVILKSTGTVPTCTPVSPACLGESQPYYVIVDTVNTIRLAMTPADAAAGTAIPITGNGTGTQSLSLIHNAFIYAHSSYGLRVKGLRILYSNTLFKGDLLDFTSLTKDAAFCAVEDSEFAGLPPAYNNPTNTHARSAINLSNAIMMTIRNSEFSFTDTGIIGKAFTGYSNSINIENNSFQYNRIADIRNAGEMWRVTGNTFEGTLDINPPNAGYAATGGAYLDENDALSANGSILWEGNWMGDSYDGSKPWITFRGHSLIIRNNQIDSPGGNYTVLIDVTNKSMGQVMLTGNTYTGSGGARNMVRVEGNGTLLKLTAIGENSLGDFGTYLSVDPASYIAKQNIIGVSATARNVLSPVAIGGAFIADNINDTNIRTTEVTSNHIGIVPYGFPVGTAYSFGIFARLTDDLPIQFFTGHYSPNLRFTIQSVVTSHVPFKIGTDGSMMNKVSSKTAVLDFTALAANSCEDIDIPEFSSITDGDVVSLGIPSSLASISGTYFTGFVKNTTTVTVRRCNMTGAATANPDAVAVRASVTNFL